MPELPDLVVYVEGLEGRIAGVTLKNIRLNNPFLLPRFGSAACPDGHPGRRRPADAPEVRGVVGGIRAGAGAAHRAADEAYFWATHAGAELDLLMFKHGCRVGVEIKHADAPSLTPSMRIAMNDLRLDRLLVLYPGNRTYSLASGIDVVPATAIAGFVP